MNNAPPLQSIRAGRIICSHYATNIAGVTAPVAVPFAVGNTVRFGVQLTTYATPTGVVTPPFDMANGAADFVVTAGAATPTAAPSREIVTTAACNACHGRLTVHGRRVELAYCATCHNYNLLDPNSFSGDLSVFIHRLHGAGAFDPTDNPKGIFDPTTPDFRGIVPANITFPQDIRHCATCHKGADGARWNTNPSRHACTSCHAKISFVSPAPTGMTLHTAGAMANDAACALCHTPTLIQGFHALVAENEAQKILPVITSVTNSAPGQNPVVKFAITNPTVSPATNYDIATSPYFTQPGGASTLTVLIGFSNADIGNAGDGLAYGQPININLLSLPTGATLVKEADGSYTLTSSVPVPATATGSGTVAIQGPPGFVDPSSGDTLRLPMQNASMAFAITDTTATARRKVVDIARCNACHAVLSLHGNNRTGDIGTCVICHNTNATDGSRRPAGGAVGVDGKAEESIDFKYMVHAIHGTALNSGITVYGFGGSVDSFAG